MAVESIPGISLTPAPEKVALATNYITNFNFLNQYLPDTYEKEFERYGNRSVASFLRMVSAEIPSTSDMIKWTEQGRLHIKYKSCTSAAAAETNSGAVWTIGDSGVTTSAIRVGQTVMIVSNGATGLFNKAIVTAVSGKTFTVAYYEADGQAVGAGVACTVFVYGSEFKKGTNGMEGSIEAQPLIKDNKPIILKDKYAINGSDMAQIGWVEVSTENGASGYLWYIKSEHETRLRFDDYLETSALEAVPAETGSGAASLATGTKGVFYEVENNGNLWGGGFPDTLLEFDTVVTRLDGQGAIEENALFLERASSFAIDDMLAGLTGYGAGGTSYGLFNNSEQMALNLGFTGFRRGYDFYKSDWKYLNDPTMRGGLNAAAGSGRVAGLLVPAGTTSVYDQVMGQNVKRPFLHVRYRQSATEDRKYKTWITGSAGGANTSDLDAMEVNFLSERATCTLGANNFFIFKY